MESDITAAGVAARRGVVALAGAVAAGRGDG
jgi:hypothetical protein